MMQNSLKKNYYGAADAFGMKTSGGGSPPLFINWQAGRASVILDGESLTLDGEDEVNMSATK